MNIRLKVRFKRQPNSNITAEIFRGCRTNSRFHKANLYASFDREEVLLRQWQKMV